MTFRGRALTVFVCLAFGFTVISWRLVQIQLVEHDKYWRLAVEKHCDRIELPARRGLILDAHGQTLAQTGVLHNVAVDGRNLLHPEKTLPEMERLLKLPAGALAPKFSAEKRYQVLVTDVTEDQMNDLKNFEIAKRAEWRREILAANTADAKKVVGQLDRFLIFEDHYLRSYPNGTYASHLVGFLDNTGKGVAGVEKAMDAALRGVSGEQWIERDARGREITGYRGRDQQPVDGSSVMLTLDLAVQNIVEDGLDKIDKKYHPAATYAIVMRPQTGDILALSNRPTYDPNNRRGVAMANFRNRCLTDMVEPGSTFKIVTLAAVLNEGLMGLDSKIFCENGRFFYADKWLHDDEPSGLLTLTEVLARSSNIGFAKLGLELGKDRLYDYARRFGFGRQTGVLPGQGESAGTLRPVSLWSNLSPTRVPMGQEVSATPLQMAVAMSVVANRGSLVKPRLVMQVNDAQGRVAQYFPPTVVRSVIGTETAKQVSHALANVVLEGTAKGKINPALHAAGKTGTAQKFVNGTYNSGKYVASFIGFVPEEDPQFVLVVMVDEPHGAIYGAQVSAPAFSDMATQIAQVMNVTVPTGAPNIVQRKASAAPNGADDEPVRESIPSETNTPDGPDATVPSPLVAAPAAPVEEPSRRASL
ncbi:cell division protein FtsI (penicillin-binding protein 3)/stage V sporulation protein D (sporulation-specific penicillin-binding protein) [Verrucomicrobium sp. GAS474]|uniref:peptidoglycan D,D-transpeptidase FtsI family protein n=1 Tax=Verrucomicrobium sp. GAS474 TaxID=1882831 RepID=UPI00087A6AA1|nr:penicillin-binding protein 2 [Verrucomicrobium sp. GAS474]SDU28871.1 cell division protein FtsI (penicillin-binding protein 3)/stage V sporulation protein D (sporulation-specific penicillin-binding protein) [Verrucomicrobium sp. GAS474]